MVGKFIFLTIYMRFRKINKGKGILPGFGRIPAYLSQVSSHDISYSSVQKRLHTYSLRSDFILIIT